MATNSRLVRADKLKVFSILEDARQYPKWVVGARAYRGEEGAFPEPGSLFHHQAGVIPFVLNDCTSVLELQRPNRIVLEASGSVLGAAEVTIELEDHPEGCMVKMTEVPVRGPGYVAKPIVEPMIKARNVLSLRRFADLVENDKT